MVRADGALQSASRSKAKHPENNMAIKESCKKSIGGSHCVDLMPLALLCNRAYCSSRAGQEKASDVEKEKSKIRNQVPW